MSRGLEKFVESHRQPEPIYVTRPSLPPFDRFTEYLKQIWQRRWLTNDGICHEELEQKLSDYLEVEHLSLVSSGTMALLLMLRAQNITSGEVITTPFTFPATVHALHWNGARPVFCDVDPQTGNIDPDQIERLITPETRAVLGVHLYGTPCDVGAVQEIADRHGLVVLYDAAHAFGARRDQRAICSYGEMSALSFHATKLFSTCEGGAVICRTAAQKEQVDYLKNFGIADEETVVGPGINGKMNELSAAYGSLQLEMVDEEIESRGKVAQAYSRELASVPGILRLARDRDVTPNHAYFPILVTDDYGVSRDTTHSILESCNIITRKYFYPLASSYSCYSALASAAPEHLPVAERLAKQVLCLPMFGSLPLSTAEEIGKLLAELPHAALVDQ